MANLGWMTEYLHGLPHVDSRLYPVVDHYVHNDPEYETGVKNLGCIPVFIILLLLGILMVKLAFQISLLPRNSVLAAYCNCLKQRWLERLLKLCLLVLFLCILLELLLLAIGLAAHKKYYLTTDYIDNYKYGETLEELEAGKRPGLAFDRTRYGTSCVLDREKVIKNRTVRPYKKLFAKFLTELQSVWLLIMRPDVEPREIETPFMKDFMQYTITRFIMCLIGWITGIGIIVCKPHRYWLVAVVGVIWCCVASNWLMRAAVKASDICHHPEYFVTNNQNRKTLATFITTHQFYLCEQFLHVCSKSKSKIRNIYYKWGLIFNKTLHKVMGEYDLVERADYKKDYRYCYMLSVCEFVKNQTEHYETKLKKGFVKCRGTTAIEEDMPEDSITALCENDKVVRWLIYQLILVMFLALLYLIMIMIHLSRPESIFASRRALIIYRAKTKKAIRNAATWVLEEKRLYPPLLPPHECYKACRHYKQAILAAEARKCVKAPDDEDEESDEEQIDPFKRKLPPLTPPCAVGRRNLCCEPVPQEEYYKDKSPPRSPKSKSPQNTPNPSSPRSE